MGPRGITGGAASAGRRWTGPLSVVLLLALQLPLAAAHGGDEGSTLATAVLREQERDVALGGKLLHRLLHDSGEAGRHRGGSLLY